MSDHNCRSKRACIEEFLGQFDIYYVKLADGEVNPYHFSSKNPYELELSAVTQITVRYWGCQDYKVTFDPTEWSHAEVDFPYCRNIPVWHGRARVMEIYLPSGKHVYSLAE